MASSSRIVAPAREGLRDLRATVRQALAGVRPGRDARAFAVDGATCVVTWRPSAESPRLHDVRLRLRDGARTREHALLTADLGLLAATCEHHLRMFLADRDLGDLPDDTRGRAPTRRVVGAPSDPAARLRARLAGIPFPVDVTE